MFQYILFRLDEQLYALDVMVVERVIRAIEITHIPQSPPAISGLIDIHGTMVPVINIRYKLQLPEQELQPENHLIIAQPHQRLIVFVVDEVKGIVTPPVQSLIAANKLLPGVHHLEGVVRTEDGIIFIHNLEQILSLSEELWLTQSLQATD